ATLRLHTRGVAIGAQQTAAFQCCERVAIAVLADPVKYDVEPLRQNTCEILALVVDRRGAELADQCSLLAARRTPYLEAGHLPEHEQRLTDGAGSSLHEHALALPYPGRAVQELIGCRPAQNHRGCLRSINGWWQPGQMVDPQGAIVGVRTQDRHVGHTVTKPKPAYVIAELINFPDDVITDYERRTPKTGLWIEVAPNQRVRVLHARGKHMHPHFSPVGRRHGSLDHLQLVRAAEASDLNNPVARLAHARTPRRSCSNFRERLAP